MRIVVLIAFIFLAGCATKQKCDRISPKGDCLVFYAI